MTLQSYRGQTKNGTREGIGTYEYTNKCFKYTGDWANGKKHGHGAFYIADGTVYSGTFTNGEITGWGTKKWPDGRCYKGPFVLGEMDGSEGEWTSADGTEFKGSFSRNTFHGQGTLTTSKHEIYIGDFVKHKKQGQGLMKYANGEMYEGEWVQNIKHGQGTHIWPSLAKYTGDWVQGQEEGCGILGDSTSGITIEGTWSGGKPALVPVRLQLTFSNLIRDSESFRQLAAAKLKPLTDSSSSNSLLSQGQEVASESGPSTPHGKDLSQPQASNPTSLTTSAHLLPTNALLSPARPPTPQFPPLLPPSTPLTARDPTTNLPILVVEAGQPLPALCIACHAAEPPPLIPTLSIAAPSSLFQPPPPPVELPPRLVEGESGRLIVLTLAFLTALAVQQAKVSKSKTKKSGKKEEPEKMEKSTEKPSGKNDLRPSESLKSTASINDPPSQPGTPVGRNPARRSRSIKTPDKMRRSPDPQAEQPEEPAPEEILPPPPPVRHLTIQDDIYTLPASSPEVPQIAEIQELLQQLEQQQSKLKEPTQAQPARPPSPQPATQPSVRPNSPSQLVKPQSPQSQNLPPKPLSPQQQQRSSTKPVPQQVQQAQQQKLQQQQQQIKQLRQQIDSLQANLLSQVQAQQRQSLLHQGFDRRSQNGLCAFADIVAPSNMECGDYVLTCLDFTQLPPPNSRAASLINICQSDSILLRVLPNSSQ